MSNSFGNLLRITVFGQSHAEAIGVVVDGLPAGETVDMERVQRFLERRAPGRSAIATSRSEPDKVRVLSGLVGGKTCGAPLCAMIENTDARPGDYDKLRDQPRPMHADFPARMKYGESHDIRGGGQFSGRLTAPLCIAGAICLQLLERLGVTIGAHLYSIGGVIDRPFDPVGISPEFLRELAHKGFPVLDEAAGERMRAEIEAVSDAKDSVGGVIECALTGLEAGIGEPIYDSVESRIASILFAIPGIKGVDFGAGFASAAMRGSEHNDAYIMREGRVVTETNRHGGVLGGITTGMPVVFRAAVKPTPSIGVRQRTVSLSEKTGKTLEITGRHDPCIAPRALPCVEAVAAVAIYDLILESKEKQRLE